MRATTLTLCLEGNTNRSSSIINHQPSISLSPTVARSAGDNRLRPSRDGVSPSATEKSSTINHPSSTINHQSSTIHHQSSIINRLFLLLC
ncbi:MAG: hypothetical protein E7077_04095 [Bacteroidales bacterium]|jgi:hypothetical protein|nr:hypothetical protein [Bacteroidales bacterium]